MGWISGLRLKATPIQDRIQRCVITCDPGKPLTSKVWFHDAHYEWNKLLYPVPRPRPTKTTGPQDKVAQSPQIILRDTVRWEHIVKLLHPAKVHCMKLEGREMS